jgi:hypothetical protein
MVAGIFQPNSSVKCGQFWGPVGPFKTKEHNFLSLLLISEVDLSKRKHLLDVTAKSSNHNRILSEIEFEIEGVGGSDGDRNGSSLYIDIIEPNRAAGVKSRWVMLVLCSLLMRRWW